MKTVTFLFTFFLFFKITAQVGIGTTSPGAQLDIAANSPENPLVIDGLLIPRVQRFPTATPAREQDGLLLYLTVQVQQFTPGFYFWSDQKRKWESLSGSGSESFYKPGTTTRPETITEPMYRMGNVGLGTQEITSRLQIEVSSTQEPGLKKGLEIDFNNPVQDNLTTYGLINNNRSATNGNKYGIKNNVGGQGNGIHYGIFTETYQNSGTNDIYGIFNRVGRTFGARSNNYGIYTQIGTTQGSGNIYGIYSSALGDHNANVYAGYFAGRLGIGSTPQEEYIFPAARGNSGQVLTLGNGGRMDWTYPNTQNYSTTGGATGNFVISDDVYSLRINDGIANLIIPPANLHRGRIINLIAWRGTKTKPLQFAGNDDLYDMVNDVSITSITGSQIITIQSAGNRWLVLNVRRAP